MTDQQWPPYDPDGSEGKAGTPAGEPPSPWGREPTITPGNGVPYGPPTAYESPPTHHSGRSGRGAPALVAAIAVATVVGVGAVYVSGDDGGGTTTATDGIDVPDLEVPDFDPPDLTPPSPGVPTTDGPPDVLSPGGLADLVDGVRRRTGGTQVFEAVLYPEYAVVDVPVDATSAREESLRWDGAFDDFGGKGTAMEERLDLGDVDPAVLLQLVRRAKKLVEDPTTSYVIIRGRSTVFADDGARIMAYASNEFNETGYLAARLDGTVVRRYAG